MSSIAKTVVTKVYEEIYFTMVCACGKEQSFSIPRGDSIEEAERFFAHKIGPLYGWRKIDREWMCLQCSVKEAHS